MIIMSAAALKRFQLSNAVIYWMWANAFMVFAMAVIGAITRLTESGLSMVEWRPLIGALPPLTEAEWHRVFELYKASPEYLQVNNWMQLEDFKQIFFWEWFHRLWGRLIGVVYFVPFVFFWIKGMLPKQYLGRFLLLLTLGAAQGVMGWYMVMSGLQDVAAVSQYRLAAHLGLALLVFFIEIWTIRDLRELQRNAIHHWHGARSVKFQAWMTFAVVVITICWGAFVAGLDAGKIYNSWPLMEGHFLPESLRQATQPLHDIHHEAGATQFTHRWLAALSFIFVWGLWARLRKLKAPKTVKKWSMAAAHMVVVQFLLGIATLLMVVPVWLGALHQAGAIILLGLMASLLQTLHKAAK